METKNLDDLKPNPKNPRRVSKHDAAALRKSIQDFGDLSGIVFNLTTQQLVGGHVRTETFKNLPGKKEVVITQRYDEPDKYGTVAYGWIVYDKQFFSYREVQWPLEREVAANIAANRIEGEWNNDLLAEQTYMLKNEFPDLLASTGQTDIEVSDLLDLVGGNGDTPPASPDQLGTLRFKLDPSQAEVVRSALYKSRTSNRLQAGSEDAEALFLICRDYLDTEEA